MKHKMKLFSGFNFLNDWKMLGAYYTIKSGEFLNNDLPVAINFTH